MRTRNNRKSGQGLVEFALVLPLLLLLVIGIAEFGRAWMTRNILTGAAREAVRIAAVTADIAIAEARGRQVLDSAGLTTATIVVTDNGTTYGTVVATSSYDFPVAIAGFIPGLGNVTFPLSSTTSMRREF